MTWTCSASAGSSCPASGAGNIAAAIDLLAGGTATFLATGAVTGTGTITNVATVTAPGGVNDAAGNNSATDNDTQITGAPDLALAKTHVGTFTVGTNAVYQLTMSNVGASSTTGVITITDVLPAGLTFVTGAGAGWACGSLGQTVTCSSPGPIAATATSAFSLTVAVGGAAVPSVTNVATVATAGDIVAANDTATDTAPVAAVNLALAKAHTGNFTVGGAGQYTLAVTNTGSVATIGSITVVDTLPLGLTFGSGVGAGWACSAVSQVVTCTAAGPLAPTASSAITLTVSVGPAAYPSVTNQASLTTLGDTLAGGDNLAIDAPTGVTGDFRLAVTKRASREVVEIAEVVDYRVVVQAMGASAIPDVIVEDALPAGFAYLAGSVRLDGVLLPDPSGAPGPQLAFPVGVIAAGDSAVLTYRVRVGPGAESGDGVNRALARSGTVSAVSNTAVARIDVHQGVFTDRALIVGKVYVECDCDSSSHRWQDTEELGIPGVRVFLEDGTSIVTDAEGKFNFVNVIARLHVVRVDPTTLPPGAALVAIDNRNAGDAASRFVDVKKGQLHKANFSVGLTPELLAAVKARRVPGGLEGFVLDTLPAGDAAPADTVALADSVIEGAWQPTAIAGVYQSLLSEPTLTDANSGLPPAPLRADSGVGTAGALAARVDLRVPRTPIPADGATVVPVAIRLMDERGS
ncbi:MAG: hypothetical protein ACREMR_03815, partial [Gemmatimonadales bacterium]